MFTLLVLLMTSTAPDVVARDEIRALHAQFVDAARARDRATLERIYADEFLFIHASGMIQDKASWIGGLLAVEKYNDLFKPDFDDLQVYGDTALLRVRSVRFGTTIYAKKGGRWQIIQVQSTTVPPARTAVAVDDKVLESYVGKYKSGARTTTVSKEGVTLKVQADGRPLVALVPDSDAHFFVKDAFAEITFFKDEAGKVTHFVHKLDGREANWQKAGLTSTDLRGVKDGNRSGGRGIRSPLDRITLGASSCPRTSPSSRAVSGNVDDRDTCTLDATEVLGDMRWKTLLRHFWMTSKGEVARSWTSAPKHRNTIAA